MFYTTGAFNIGQRTGASQFTDGFLSDSAGGGSAIEDPLWTGTRIVGSQDQGATSVAVPHPSALKRAASEVPGE